MQIINAQIIKYNKGLQKGAKLFNFGSCFTYV